MIATRRWWALVLMTVALAGCGAASATTRSEVEEAKLAERVARQVIAQLRAEGVLPPRPGAAATTTPREVEPPAAPAEPDAPADPTARGARARVSTTGAPARGAREPLVTIVEFTDFQCPYCSRVAPRMQQLLDAFPDEVRIVIRNNPLPFHQNAREAAMAAAEAQAQQGDAGFFRMHDLLFANQQSLERADLLRYATEIGLDIPRFRRALDQGTHTARIDADVADAERLSATGTPAFFLNGRMMMGAQPYESFEAIVRSELATARLLMQRGVARSQVATRILSEPNPSPPDGEPAPPPARRQLDPNAVYRVPVDGAPSRGPADAPVTLVVFSDFQCPFCSRLSPTLEELRERYPRDLRIVWRHNPLAFHENAMPAAELAAEAFAQRGDAGFWAVHDLLFANQGSLERADLLRYAREARLNVGQVRTALDDHRHRAAIQADAAIATGIGATGTPASFINGRNLRGAQPLDAFTPLVDQALADARRRIAGGTPRAGVYQAVTGNGATAPVYLP